MHVTRLTASALRRFQQVELLPGPGLNLITGDNGAGKTSLLEALHLMAYGRSFRGRVRDGLVRQGQEALEVFVEWQEIEANAPGETDDPILSPESVRRHRAGLRHSGHTWEGRLDGEKVNYLGELCAALAVVSFEPGSHALVSGGGEPRRRFVDWGLFHVEPDFLSLWRRYARALKQRNALLKAGAPGAQLDAWDRELTETGEPLTRRRQQYMERLGERMIQVAAELAPGLGAQNLIFNPGWRRQELSLADGLLLSRERDRASGYTTVGPHRADWLVEYAEIPGRDALSRGQAKLTALACLLAQAGDYAAMRKEWPIIALDDLASELDVNHQRRVLDLLRASRAQVFVTATETPVPLMDPALSMSRFHVEHGGVSRL